MLIREGNTGQIGKLLARNPDVNVPDDQGWTPLMYAIFWQDINLMNKLLLHKADVNVQDKSGITPLIATVDLMAIPLFDPMAPQHLGFIKTAAQMLLRAGADPNKAENTGKTPLFIAARHSAMRGRAPGYGKILDEVVSVLLGHGADPNKADIDGKTPLMIAASAYSDNLAAMLLKAGANPNQEDKEGRPPIYFPNNPSSRYIDWAPSGAFETCSNPFVYFPEYTPEALARIEYTSREEAVRMKKLLMDAGATDRNSKSAPASPVRTQASPMIDMRDRSKNLPQFFNISYYVGRVLIDSNGKVKDSVIMIGVPDGDAERFRAEILKQKYFPGIKNGQAAECWTIYGRSSH